MRRVSRTAWYRWGALVVGTTMLAAVMWYSAALQLTGGLIDLAVFAPPGVALGLTATWGAHAFAPERFSWRRGLIGALVGGLIAGPLIGFLIALAAAWNPASYHVVFSAGASVALAGGLVVGGVAWIVSQLRKRLRTRNVTRRITRRTLSGIPTPSRSHDAVDPKRPGGDVAMRRVHAGGHEDAGQRRDLVGIASGRGLAG